MKSTDACNERVPGQGINTLEDLKTNYVLVQVELEHSWSSRVDFLKVTSFDFSRWSAVGFEHGKAEC